MQGTVVDGVGLNSLPSPSQSTTANEARDTPSRPPPTIPFIALHRPAQGQAANMTDEHCLIYCRQTADHRKQGRKPICRTVCLRRVFKSEMESSFSSSEQDVPLPPEGQPQYTLLDAEPLPASTSYSPSTASDRNPTLLTKSPQGAESQRQQERPRIWQPGYYLWTSASSRAAQERIETMAMDIGREHDWIRKREEWIKQQQKVLGEMGVFIRNNEISLPANISGKWIGLDGNGNGDDGAENRRILLGDGIALTSSGQIEGPWSHSRLWQLSFTGLVQSVLEPLETLVSPTSRALGHVSRAFESGSLSNFATRAWEKAWSPEPADLARRACRSALERWKDGGEGERNES